MYRLELPWFNVKDVVPVCFETVLEFQVRMNRSFKSVRNILEGYPAQLTCCWGVVAEQPIENMFLFLRGTAGRVQPYRCLKYRVQAKWHRYVLRTRFKDVNGIHYGSLCFLS